MSRVKFYTALLAAATATLFFATGARGESDIPLPEHKKLRPMGSQDGELLSPSSRVEVSGILVGPKLYHKHYPDKLAVTLKAATWVSS